MARIRTLKPEIWDHAALGALSYLARLTFIGLISLADDEGIGRGESEWLWGQIHGHSKASAKRWWTRAIKELRQVRDDNGPLVVFYKVSGSTYYWLPGFCKQQYIERPSKSKFPHPPDSGNGRGTITPGTGTRNKDQGTGIKEQARPSATPPDSPPNGHDDGGAAVAVPDAVAGGETAETGGTDAPTTPPRPRDPLLEQVSIRRGAELLADLGFAHSLAMSFAGDRPVGEILDLVVHARTRKSPAGHARRALEKRWTSPVCTGPEVDELLAKLREDAAAMDGRIKSLTGGIGLGGPKIERLPGESDDDWLRRIQETRLREAKA